LAVVGISDYVYYVIQKNDRTGVIGAVSFILVGAIENIIDRTFYGMIFSESGNYINRQPAELFPEEGGYASFLQGRVVDMFYFPVIRTSFPDWFMGGREFIFFRPVFNFADAAITVGVFMLLIFQHRYFQKGGNGIKPVANNSTTALNIDKAQDYRQKQRAEQQETENTA
ncbi:MAG: signal peptidase II, partial [Bacteroidales bacterium]